MLVSLGRTVLKCTVPGCARFLPGHRSSVGFFSGRSGQPPARRLCRSARRSCKGSGQFTRATSSARWPDGAVKLKLTSDPCCAIAATMPLFYARADYAPLTVTGDKWSRLVAFSRAAQGRDDRRHRAAARRERQRDRRLLPIGPHYWGGTTVELARRASGATSSRAQRPRVRWARCASAPCSTFPVRRSEDGRMSDKHGKGKHKKDKSDKATRHDMNVETNPRRYGRRAPMPRTAKVEPASRSMGAGGSSSRRSPRTRRRPPSNQGRGRRHRHGERRSSSPTATKRSAATCCGGPVGPRATGTIVPMTFLGNDRWTAILFA